MKKILSFIFLPLILGAFEPKIITPFPIVGYQEIPFFDESQKVERSLLIWYPVDPSILGSTPTNPWDVFKTAVNAPIAKLKAKPSVIVISHGYTGDPHQLSWLVNGLVHSNFIVIAIQHRDLVNGRTHINHWHRAQDISIVIDQFSKTELALAANLNKIGIVGYSIGGTTAVWVAGGRATKIVSLISGGRSDSTDKAVATLNSDMISKDWTDPRIKAAFLMAPAWAWIFDEGSLKRIKIPTYIIAAEKDEILAPKSNAGIFAKGIPNAYYQEIPGKGGHYIFISAVNDEIRKLVDPTNRLRFLIEDDPSIDRNWIQFQIIGEASGFFNSEL